jgi:hypothetical protein
MFDSIIKGYSPDGSINTAASFGPIDKAEGYGIPPSWREKNFLKVISRYGDRVARRFAYHDNIENTPLQETLFGPKGISGHKEISRVLDSIRGVRPVMQQNVEAVNGVVKALAMGTVSGIRDLATVHTLGAQHSDFFKHPQAVLSAWTNLKRNLKESFQMGVNKTHIGALETNDYDYGNDFINILRRTRKNFCEASSGLLRRAFRAA